MVKAKRIVSLMMVLALIVSSFSMFSVTALAATTSDKRVVSYNAVAGGTIKSAAATTITVKSNFWTKKKITIENRYTGWFEDAEGKKAFKKLARFDVVVKDKNGKVVSTYKNKSLGFKFYLPQWKTENYTITVSSYFVGYKKGATGHGSAALVGKYRLKY